MEDTYKVNMQRQRKAENLSRTKWNVKIANETRTCYKCGNPDNLKRDCKEASMKESPKPRVCYAKKPKKKARSEMFDERNQVCDRETKICGFTMEKDDNSRIQDHKVHKVKL